jgi:hypothetical protein
MPRCDLGPDASLPAKESLQDTTTIQLSQDTGYYTACCTTIKQLLRVSFAPMLAKKSS